MTFIGFQMKANSLTCTLLKEVENSLASAATEGAKPDEQSKDDGVYPDSFDENFKELKKWVDVKCTKYGILLVTHERRGQRLGTALKVFSPAKSCYVTEYFLSFLPLSYTPFELNILPPNSIPSKTNQLHRVRIVINLI